MREGVSGRPRRLEGGKQVTVYLDEVSLARAETLGEGNISEGVRNALLIAPPATA